MQIYSEKMRVHCLFRRPYVLDMCSVWITLLDACNCCRELVRTIIYVPSTCMLMNTFPITLCTMIFWTCHGVVILTLYHWHAHVFFLRSFLSPAPVLAVYEDAEVIKLKWEIDYHEFVQPREYTYSIFELKCYKGASLNTKVSSGAYEQCSNRIQKIQD